MAEYALRLENGTDTAPRVRLGEGVHRFPDGSLAGRGGLRPDGGGAVTVNTGTMGVEVSPLLAYVPGGSSSTQGGYTFVLDAAKTLTLTDGDGALSRTDTIAVVVNEDAYDGSGSTGASVAVVTGTPGAGAPTLPPSAIALRDVTVPAGLSAGTGGLASGNLGADRRPWTVAAGGILPVSGVTERDALTVVAGQAVYRIDTGTVQVYNGTSWGTIDPASGSAVATATGSYAGTITATALPNGLMALTGHVTRASGSNSSLHSTGAVLPEGFRPPATALLAASTEWNGPESYRYRVDTDGTVNIQETGAITTNMVINAVIERA